MIPARFDERYDPEPDWDRDHMHRDLGTVQRRRDREYLLELVPEGLESDDGLEVDVDERVDLTLF